eukprot:TRINITY_DN71722_c0_g1_i1.p1 TRINITY_DN71722_c0_g1~~TRINITY_DN71722_c0_g1_i1.p1  ORF type:complete len:368 (-),score=79.59 TRINITY_DN71722_c0_g1_i1:115-1218(-)
MTTAFSMHPGFSANSPLLGPALARSAPGADSLASYTAALEAAIEWATSLPVPGLLDYDPELEEDFVDDVQVPRPSTSACVQAQEAFRKQRQFSRGELAREAAAALLSPEARALEAGITLRYAGCCPLVYHGLSAEHPDCAAVALLDQPEANACELHVYRRGDRQHPSLRLSIAPRTRLVRSKSAPGGPALATLVTGSGRPLRTLELKDDEVLAALERDFAVRQRLAELALQAARHRVALARVREELEGIWQSRAVRWLWRMVQMSFLMLSLAGSVRIAVLAASDQLAAPFAHSHDVRPALGEYVDVLKDEANVLLARLRSAATEEMARKCEELRDVVRPDDLRSCLDFEAASEVTNCLNSLLPGPEA